MAFREVFGVADLLNWWCPLLFLLTKWQSYRVLHLCNNEWCL